ncbi:NAD(P)H-hydrate dehydratase [Micromonospora rifamycinica]|uniref:ADP-dependent (S)-NAD(P)H-hydrate dehydratase n=1 Tax=Micromonospora rifamycinica TaxID=291594 RepID=A0A125Q0N0_9ACTN|nr:NAD(P)H-hydrate dehydratase [Micromonospora rifamycinica]KWV29526.1 carbohydrate kinase [Micromonospora rifamycinica]SCG43496.1 yjeF C-terminal region, hydroxyethylthiazole kinase-related [Micromonospora rifamycinica]
MPNRSETRVITPGLLRDWALPVPTGGKDNRGTVLVVGGSRFTPGAVLLAGVAALRAGAGVLQLATAESTAAALSIQVPEAMVVGLPETADGAVAGDPGDRLGELVERADVVTVGPGLNDIDQTRALLRLVLSAAGPHTALVFDAYALGALSHDPDLLVGADRKVVLTPNLTEARHLLGRDPGDDLDADSRELARRYEAVVSLYGHIATPDGQGWREESGDAGLGTSGSGDVRAGLLAGLLSRGAEPAQAACWAAWVHAVSGQRLVPRFGRIGFLARELLDEIPHTIATV